MKKLFTFLFVFTFIQLSFGQFSGDYYIGVGQTYTTLKAACDAINAGTVTGNVTFYITSDLTEATNVGLGVNTAGFSITFKPDSDADRTITFTQLSDNTSPTGHFVIGYLGTGLSSAWSDANTIATSNVTIDGYANGGTTKRLIFTNTNASHTNARVIVVVGACENTIIKNCIINNLTTHIGSPFCVGAVVRFGTAIDVAPINLTIENNTLTAIGNNVAMGVRITNSNTPTSRLTGFVFKNNIVMARRRLLEINYTTGGDINNNEFTTLQTGVPATVSYGVWTSTAVTGTVNIYNNKFLQSTTQETGAFGHRVVSLSSGATYNVFNNTFAGMDKTAASTVGLNLTYLFYSGVAGKIYSNTFYMPSLTNATSTGYYSCIQLSGNTAEIKNNIFISDEATHTNPYFISAVPTPASDYNDFYMRQSNVNHKVVSTYTTLVAYQSANPTKDVNSKSVNVTFVSTTDLHLAGTSLGDVNLIGTPLSAPFNVDIDGEGRHAAFPYIGADETDFPLPVELTSFTASVIGSKVKLNWQTATEINNYGFEIERASLSASPLQVWEKIGFVNGNGNSNSQKSYSFTDENISTGKYSYRLKQIDNDGTFEFSSTIEVDLGIPKEFQLSQNYPNPFNPMTKIHYTLPVEAQVTLQLYSITGELLESLVSENQTTGSYTIDFDGSNYASGTYIYRLVANDFVQTKKMTLIK